MILEVDRMPVSYYCGRFTAFATKAPSHHHYGAHAKSPNTCNAVDDEPPFSQTIEDWVRDQKVDHQRSTEDPSLLAPCPTEVQVNAALESSHDTPTLVEPPPASEPVRIQLLLEDDVWPMTIVVSRDATVGSIAVAESKLGVFSQPVRLSTSVGTP